MTTNVTGNSMKDASAARLAAPRVFISYAHGDAGHKSAAEHLYAFLRANGVDAGFDAIAATEPQDWARWMTEQLREADFVLVVASPE